MQYKPYTTLLAIAAVGFSTTPGVAAVDCEMPPDDARAVTTAVEDKYGGKLHFREAIDSPVWKDSNDDGAFEETELVDAKRYFHVYEPDAFVPGNPAVIVMHGGSLCYNTVINVGDKIVPAEGEPYWEGSTTPSEWLEIASEEGFLVIAPNGTRPVDGQKCSEDSAYCDEQTTTVDKQHWNDCRKNAGSSTVHSDDVEFVRRIIDRVDADFGIDLTRVYATGASNGGMMTYRLGRELSGSIAAISASIANNPLSLTGNDACQAPSTPMPVMMMNGTLDLVMPFVGGCLTGCVKSAPATRTDWRQWNNAPRVASRTIHYPNLAIEGSTVTCKVYGPGGADAEVRYCRVDGGGHSEPSIEHPVPPGYEVIGLQNRDVETAREFWDFLQGKNALDY